ncbi:nucleotidyltransferase family protein [Virgibacillus halodenitrificans]|uniref:nucleotidyltransferase family protein n=1 Tax=Virgibacillus halodenitrificans TaxID=1482 RepID=UPI001F3152CD|nr:nucleotidyltransferase family protein [Virgibacillus halodenitrificans]
MLKSKEDIVHLLKSDREVMEILKAVKALKLPDWWVCAGYIRAKIWDALSGYDEPTRTADVDVIYFNPNQLDEQIEKQLEEKLISLMPHIPWSVKNEARMHMVNQIPAYTSAEDAISKFPETVTALGLKLDEENKMILTAPWGITDVLEMEVNPTPYFLETKERMAIYEKRIREKDWTSIWSKVTVSDQR